MRQSLEAGSLLSFVGNLAASYTLKKNLVRMLRRYSAEGSYFIFDWGDSEKDQIEVDSL